MNTPILLTINDLVERTQLPKSWWYLRTRETGPEALPRVRCGKYLRFDWDEDQAWLRKQKKEN